MTSLSFRIYITSNLLVGAFFFCLALPLGAGSLAILAAVLAFSFLFSIPAGFALYYSFAIVNFINARTWLRWTVFLILLFLVSSIPYLFASGALAGELNSREFRSLLYISEGCAFGATLLHCLPIHRFLKNTSHENQ